MPKCDTSTPLSLTKFLQPFEHSITTNRSSLTITTESAKATLRSLTLRSQSWNSFIRLSHAFSGLEPCPSGLLIERSILTLILSNGQRRRQMDTTTAPKFVSTWIERRRSISLTWQPQFGKLQLRTQTILPILILMTTPQPVILRMVGSQGSQPFVPPPAQKDPLPISSTHNRQPAASHLPATARLL